MSVTLLPLSAIIFFAAMVGGTTGLGFGMISVIAMSLLVSPKDAVILLSVMVPPLTLVQAIYHRAYAGQGIKLPWLLVPAIVGVLVGVVLFSALPESAIGILLGVLILIFVGLRFLDVTIRIAPEHQRIAGPIAGLTGGILSGTSGVSGPVFASYLLSIGARPRTFAFTLSAIYAVITSVRLAGFALTGSLSWVLLTTGSLLLIPAMIGQWVGFRIQRSSTAGRLERIVLLILLVTALRVLEESILG